MPPCSRRRCASRRRSARCYERFDFVVRGIRVLAPVALRLHPQRHVEQLEGKRQAGGPSSGTHNVYLRRSPSFVVTTRRTTPESGHEASGP